MGAQVDAIFLCFALHDRSTHDDITDWYFDPGDVEFVLARECEHIGRIVPGSVAPIQRTALIFTDDTNSDFAFAATSKHGTDPFTKLVRGRQVGASRGVLHDDGDRHHSVFESPLRRSSRA